MKQFIKKRNGIYSVSEGIFDIIQKIIKNIDDEEDDTDNIKDALKDFQKAGDNAKKHLKKKVPGSNKTYDEKYSDDLAKMGIKW